MISLRVAVLVVVTAIGLGGCGATCKEVQRRADRVAGELRHPAVRGHHMRVRIPLVTVNRSLADVLAAGPVAVPFEIPAPRGLPLPKTRGLLRVESLALEPTERGHLRFSVRAAVVALGASVFHFSAVADAEPRIARRGDATYIELRIGLGDVAAFRPRLPNDAADRLVTALLGGVAKMLRDRIPRSLLRQFGEHALEEIAVAGVRTLLQGIEDWLGTRAQIRFRLPDVPIAGVDVVSDRQGGGALVAAIRTTLPVADVVPPQASDVRDSAAISVALSADAAMVFANWAIETGRAPQHYNRDLEPVVSGKHRPLFQWLASDSERPLKVHIVRDHAPCSYIRAAFAPAVEIEQGKLRVVLSKRDIEEVVGPTSLALGARVSNMLGLSLETTKQAAAKVAIRVGDLELLAETKSARLAGGALIFELAASATRR